MKTIKNYFASLSIVIAMPLSVALAQNTPLTGSSSNVDLVSTASVVNPGSALISHGLAGGGDDIIENEKPHLNFTVDIPAARQSQIVRTDYENQSVFSLKAVDKIPVFLFSVTKVTGEQWMTLKTQLKGYKIIENKDGFITFAEKTDVMKIKGLSDTQCHQVLKEVDTMVASILVD